MSFVLQRRKMIAATLLVFVFVFVFIIIPNIKQLFQPNRKNIIANLHTSTFTYNKIQRQKQHDTHTEDTQPFFAYTIEQADEEDQIKNKDYIPVNHSHIIYDITAATQILLEQTLMQYAILGSRGSKTILLKKRHLHKKGYEWSFEPGNTYWKYHLTSSEDDAFKADLLKYTSH